jgi:hypothetical protein
LRCFITLLFGPLANEWCDEDCFGKAAEDRESMEVLVTGASENDTRLRRFSCSSSSGRVFDEMFDANDFRESGCATTDIREFAIDMRL